jgi:hypothetical protein
MQTGDSREGAFGSDGHSPDAPLAPVESESRALTIVAQPSPRDLPHFVRGDAAFLAHLIATKEQLPQTRIKRRAEPEEALAVYRAVAGMIR